MKYKHHLNYIYPSLLILGFSFSCKEDLSHRFSEKAASINTDDVLTDDSFGANIPPDKREQKWIDLANALMLNPATINLSDDEKAEIRAQNLSATDQKLAMETLISEKAKKALGTPSGFFKPENNNAYIGLLDRLSQKWTKDEAHFAQCAAIRKFEELDQTRFHHKKLTESAVYKLEFHTRKNAEGDIDPEIHQALVFVPKNAPAKTKHQAVGYCHGDDIGLVVDQLVDDVDVSQHLVLAAAYPGEPICYLEEGCRRGGDISPAQAGAVDNPWSSDVNEVSALLDCFKRLKLDSAGTSYRYTKEQGTSVERQAAKDKLAEVRREIVSLASQKTKADPRQMMAWKTTIAANTATAFGIEIEDKVYQNLNEAVLKRMDRIDRPDSKPFSLLGSSRGGMVMMLAAARQGATWYTWGKTFESLRSVLGIAPDEKMPLMTLFSQRNESLVGLVAQNEMGQGQFVVPMLFQRAAQISGPTTVTLGRFRYALRAMVLGHFQLTAASKLPGLSKLPDLFADYRQNDSPKALNAATLEIVSRDVSFALPFALAAIKEDNYGIAGGRILLIHGKGDDVVPDEQSLIAFNMITAAIHNPSMAKMTLSIEPHKLSFRQIPRPAERADKVFHLGAWFWQQSNSIVYSKSVKKEAMESFLAWLAYRLLQTQTGGLQDQNLETMLTGIRKLASEIYGASGAGLFGDDFASDLVTALNNKTSYSELMSSERQTVLVRWLAGRLQDANKAPDPNYVDLETWTTHDEYWESNWGPSQIVETFLRP